MPRRREARYHAVQKQACFARFGNRFGLRELFPRGRRLRVEEQCGHATSGDTVEEAVVVLHQEADAPIDQAVEIPDLPQWMRTVELLAEDLTDHRGRFPRAAGRRNLDAAHVTTHVKFLVGDPNWARQPKRNLLQSPSEFRDRGQPRRDTGNDGIKRELGDTHRVNDAQPCHMLMPRRRLAGQKERVRSREPLHNRPPLAPILPRRPIAG